MPFITEELWHRVAPLLDRSGESIMLQSFPKQEELETDNDAVKQIERIKQFIIGVRRKKAERDVAPGKFVDVEVKEGTEEEIKWLGENDYMIRSVGNISSIEFTDNEPKIASSFLVGHMKVYTLIEMDFDAEHKKVSSELEKLGKEKNNLENRLSDKNFTEKAPKEVVEVTKQKLSDTLLLIESNKDQLKIINEHLNK